MARVVGPWRDLLEDPNADNLTEIRNAATIRFHFGQAMGEVTVVVNHATEKEQPA